MFVYYRIPYRIVARGHIPHKRGPTLLVANHQHEIESAVVVSDMTVMSLSWRSPIFTVSSRRMWEPGFFAERIPWLSPLLRSLNFGWLFSAIGMQPIENELNVRPFVSIAFALHGSRGDLPVTSVFAQSGLARLPSSVKRIGDLLRPKHFAIGRERIKLTEICEPYRKELLELTRREVDADLSHFEALARSGATIFLTPEGHYTGDGKMQRLRGALARLAPLTEIWLVGISYDPFVGRRLAMHYRVAASSPGVALDVQLKRLRPVTTSALLGTWLQARTEPAFTSHDAQTAIRAALAELPAALFVDPELRRQPDAMVVRALKGLEHLGIVQNSGDRLSLSGRRVHPQFPRTADIIEYMFNFHQETLEGARAT